MPVIGEAGEEARDVGVDNRHRLIEGEGGDGVCGVTAQAGQGAEFFG